MRTKGKFIFKSTWYSICSRHMGNYKEDCHNCNTGLWYNNIIKFFDSKICHYIYPLWYWWHNRPNSKSMKFINNTFNKK